RKRFLTDLAGLAIHLHPAKALLRLDGLELALFPRGLRLIAAGPDLGIEHAQAKSLRGEGHQIMIQKASPIFITQRPVSFDFGTREVELRGVLHHQGHRMLSHATDGSPAMRFQNLVFVNLVIVEETISRKCLGPAVAGGINRGLWIRCETL